MSVRRQPGQDGGHPAIARGRAGAQERTLSLQTYEELRRAIVQGRIRPNERLIETELAEEYGVSRTPIREGLQRLSVEGLIEPLRRGWRVREYSLDEIREIYEIRAALESYSARLAAERAGQSQLQAVMDIVNQRTFAPPIAGAADELAIANNQFHSAIVAAAGNDRLRQQVQQSAEYFFTYQLAKLYSAEEIGRSASEHTEIAAAMLRRDADEAGRLMRQHIEQALATIVDRLR